jgi:IclR family acetate operon transcriptional repressor
VLAVLEAIARHQPVGVSALARLLNADKSAIQRAIMTLADDNWIRAASGTPTRWELTHHILTVAYMGHGEDDLRQRARSTLDQLRDESGESALLAVPDVHNFIIIETAESRQMLRTTLSIGLVVPADNSATGRAVLPFFPPERQIELLGGDRPTPALLDHFRQSRQRGYSVSDEVVIDGIRVDGATTISAPVFDADGRPLGAIGITGPSERLTPRRQAEIGPMVAAAGRALSRGRPGPSYDQI